MGVLALEEVSRERQVQFRRAGDRSTCLRRGFAGKVSNELAEAELFVLPLAGSVIIRITGQIVSIQGTAQ